MASFTGAGDSVELTVANRDEDVTISISGTYNMTILFQREQGSPGSGSWETLETYSTANATVSEVYTTKSYNEKLRLFVSVDTSGTATATLSEGSREFPNARVTDGAGTTLMSFTDKAVNFVGGVRNGDAMVSITADTTLTADEHAGRLLVLNNAAGDTVTLPAATGTGDTYTFYVGTTVTSNTDIIQAANTTDEFAGVIYQVDTDTSDAIAAYPALAGDNFDTITLNGTTKGGLAGDFYQLVDIASGVWALYGFQNASGSVASPLSAA